jgi:hypothetical protein
MKHRDPSAGGPATPIQPPSQDHRSSRMKRIFTDLQNELADLIKGGNDRKIMRQEYSCLKIFLSTIFLSAWRGQKNAIHESL